jgi:hypothetical protein
MENDILLSQKLADRLIVATSAFILEECEDSEYVDVTIATAFAIVLAHFIASVGDDKETRESFKSLMFASIELFLKEDR